VKVVTYKCRACGSIYRESRFQEIADPRQFFGDGISSFSSAPYGTPDRTEWLRIDTCWHHCEDNKCGVAEVVSVEVIGD
jgi:hypothetical protein